MPGPAGDADSLLLVTRALTSVNRRKEADKLVRDRLPDWYSPFTMFSRSSLCGGLLMVCIIIGAKLVCSLFVAVAKRGQCLQQQ